MPTTIEEIQTIYVHCGNPRCRYNEPEPAEGVRRTTSFTYGDRGGDAAFAAFIENTLDEYVLIDMDLLPCPEGHGDRIISPTPRPEVPHTTGFDQKGLLYFKDAADKEIRDLKKSTEVKDSERDATVARLEGQIAALMGMIAQGGQQPSEPSEPVKRGPGRPPKTQGAGE